MTDQPTDATAVDEAAQADHEALQGGTGRDGGPQDRDAMAAADDLKPDGGVAKEYEDALERGANQRGEGRVP